MREFSTFEKKLIKKLVILDIEDSNIGDFITNNILKNRMIQFQDKKISLFNQTIDDKNKFISELIETFSLIKYLEENSLIFVQNNPNILSRSNGNALLQRSEDFQYDEKTQWIVNKKGEKIDLNITILETSLYDLLIKYINSFFTPGTEIKEYVKNNFQSIEQKKHNQILFWTRAAFIVALIPALIGVGEKIYNIFFL